MDLVIGDVTDHSIASASILCQVRSVIRAYAIDGPMISRVTKAYPNAPSAELTNDATKNGSRIPVITGRRRICHTAASIRAASTATPSVPYLNERAHG